MRRFAFLCFLLSGFCSLVYQIVWTRLAMAAFGVNSQVIAVVLSAFMFGLGVGSWLAGVLYDRRKDRPGFQPLIWYAGCEALIGLGGALVPLLFLRGRTLLLDSGTSDSGTYFLLSGGVLFLTLVPWCTAMGATVPLMMGALRQEGESETTFSFLYLANLLGALVGVLAPPFLLVELLGFWHTGLNAALLNLLVAGLALLAVARARQSRGVAPAETAAAAGGGDPAPVPLSAVLLFVTGFVSLAMEVAWARMYTPYVFTEVYAFAGMLASYLFATALGSWVYRLTIRWGRSASVFWLWCPLMAASLLPLASSDPRVLDGWSWGRVVLGVAPFCAVLGYLTPMIVDRYSVGNPAAAGRAYAINVLGCILGPLAAGFLLLPALGVENTMILLNAVLLGVGVVLAFAYRPTAGRRLTAATAMALMAAVFTASAVWVRSPYVSYPPDRIRHDYAATVVAGGEGLDARLFVNGVGMTFKTTDTKLMAHLPVAHLPREPRNGLVICFGMGTTFRSLLSWDIETTAVELIPSVVSVFPYYHEDAGQILGRPDAKVVIDDGRRFLDRTSEKFDVIILDPPPPAEAAGSSLLYSAEFYESAKAKLAPGGIVQQWVPSGAGIPIATAVTNTLRQAFPHVRAYWSLENNGIHYLASMEPIPRMSPAELEARLPEKVRRDLAEWRPTQPREMFAQILKGEFDVANFELWRSHDSVITDDTPFNEYYFVRNRFSLAHPGDRPPAGKSP